MQDVPTARPVRRLTTAGFLWCVLAAFPLVLALSIPTLSLGVVGAVLLRGGLGAFALWMGRSFRRDARARLGPARLVFIAGPILLVLGHQATSSMSREPTVFLPEERLGESAWVGSHGTSGRKMFRDPDTPAMIIAGGLLAELGLGVSILLARKRVPRS